MFASLELDYSLIQSPMSPQQSKRPNPSFKPHAKFSTEEDELLKHLVQQYGEDNWNSIANMMNNRNPRQCRERYQYYLSPKLNRGEWSSSEDALLCQKVEEFGNKWVKISKFFPDRTDAMVKNRYQVLLRRSNKQQRKMQKYPQQINFNAATPYFGTNSNLNFNTSSCSSSNASSPLSPAQTSPQQINSNYNYNYNYTSSSTYEIVSHDEQSLEVNEVQMTDLPSLDTDFFGFGEDFEFFEPDFLSL